MQVAKVMVPLVPGVHGALKETPWEPDVVELLVPLIWTVPEVLTIELVALRFTPIFAAPLCAVPVREIAPVVVFAWAPTPLKKIPWEAVLLAPPVPFRVIDPPPVVVVNPTPTRMP